MGVKINQPSGVLIIVLITVITVTIATFKAVSQMSFGILGQTPEESAWSYTVALVISLAIAGLSSSFRGLIYNRMLNRIVTTLSGTTSAALLGFYYGGSSQNNNFLIAIISAVIAALVGAIICIKFNQRPVRVAVAVAGGIANYGLAFLLSSLAFGYLSTQNIILGSLWSCVTLITIALTMYSFNLAIQEITRTNLN